MLIDIKIEYGIRDKTHATMQQWDKMVRFFLLELILRSELFFFCSSCSDRISHIPLTDHRVQLRSSMENLIEL